MTARVQVLVSGRVQGVGFRDWVRREADRRELAGSARNLSDGRVEIVAQGERATCESLLDALRGHTPGSVSDVAVEWLEPQTDTDGFTVG